MHRLCSENSFTIYVYLEYQPIGQEVLVWWSLLHQGKHRFRHRRKKSNLCQSTFLRIGERSVDVRIGLNLLYLENKRFVLHLLNANVHSIGVWIRLGWRKDLLFVQNMHQRVVGMLKVQEFIDWNWYLPWIPKHFMLIVQYLNCGNYSVYLKWEVACLQVLCEYTFRERLRKSVKKSSQTGR